MSAGEGGSEWVKAAITDDTLVADLLVRLHAFTADEPFKPPALPPLEWTVRQRRSKHFSSANNVPKKLAQRASPTTPLSWSFATSLSGGSAGAGDEESSRFTSRIFSSPAPRSKVNGESEKSASKRMRKKKTLAELKDEESKLIKEKRELKRELSALHVNLEKQRATNENLKRIKIELQPVLDTVMISAAEESISGQLHQTAIADDVKLQPSTSNSSPEPKFVLPDLNMPLEEDLCLDVVCARPPPPPPTYVPV